MVIVLNDDHNTFDHVAQTLARVIPGVSLDQGYAIADSIHNSGRAAVWTGPRETAELYWEQLSDAGFNLMGFVGWGPGARPLGAFSAGLLGWGCNPPATDARRPPASPPDA